MRLFKSFAAQGRLAVVTRTLADSATDMVHFFIVFFSVYFCMAVNSVLIFGQDIEAYCDLQRATYTVFRFMFGEWDWSEMDEGTQWISAVWFWTFVLVMSVILLNFLLAILMDSYAEVKESSMDEQDLMTQIDTMMRRRNQNKAKERVKLNFIYETYLKDRGDGDEKLLLADKTLVTPDDVMKKVPGIPKSQAQRTIQNAKDKFAEPSPAYGPEEIRHDLETVNDRTQSIRDVVGDIRQKVERYDSTQSFEHKQVDYLSRPPPPRAQILDAITQEIGYLRSDIRDVIREEVTHLAHQNRDLESHNRTALSSIEETRSVMQEIRRATEAAKNASQRQVIFNQRASSGGMKPSKAGNKGLLSSCAAPAPGVKTRMAG